MSLRNRIVRRVAAAGATGTLLVACSTSPPTGRSIALEAFDEFGMLVTLTNLIASISLWLGLFGFWVITPPGTEVSATTTEALDQ